MSRLTANTDIDNKAVTKTKGIYRSNWKRCNGILCSLQKEQDVVSSVTRDVRWKSLCL